MWGNRYVGFDSMSISLSGQPKATAYYYFDPRFCGYRQQYGNITDEMSTRGHDVEA